MKYRLFKISRQQRLSTTRSVHRLRLMNTWMIWSTMHSAISTTQISTCDSTLMGALCPVFSRSYDSMRDLIRGCFLTESKMIVIVIA